jgi:hypothetical protein
MTNDVDGSAASDFYAAYRLAGELFGRLETALGFGELTLHKDARVFVFSGDQRTMPRTRSVKRHPSGFANPQGYPDSWQIHDFMLKNCQQCGEKFIRYGNGRRRLFCCQACRKAASRKRSHESVDRSQKVEPSIRDNDSGNRNRNQGTDVPRSPN